jgi:CHAD domain-containing protein
MAYYLKAKESVPAGLKRVAREELEYAAGQLEAQDANRDEAIHEARKSLKKTRAILRLMQGELGSVYRLENTSLRDLGRTLSEFRDAGAMIETFDGLKEKHRAELGRRTLGSVRRALLERKSESEQKAGIDGVLAGAAKTLRAAAKNVEQWPLDRDGFRAIAGGLKSTYARGRKAMEYAEKHPQPESFHEWRKRVKDHWYHVRLLESLWTGDMRAYEKSLKELETCLGDDHNLVMLRAKIEAAPARHGTSRDRVLLQKLMERRQEELRSNAESVGRRIFKEKPKQFIQRLELLWSAWRAAPPALKPVPPQATESAKAAGTAA